jgi:HEAT repeat protein
MNAISALSDIAPADTRTLPTLIHLLDDLDDLIEQSACIALSHFGPEAQAAVPGLHRCLKTDAIGVQFSATLALWRIAKEPPSIAILKTAIGQDDNGYFVPLRTLEMLGGLSAQTDETKSIIRQLSQSSTAEVRTNALALLQKIGE